MNRQRTVDSKKLKFGSRMIYDGVPFLFCFVIKGLSYSNVLASTVHLRSASRPFMSAVYRLGDLLLKEVQWSKVPDFPRNPHGAHALHSLLVAQTGYKGSRIHAS